MSDLKVNRWLNPDGTENYKCRAWVNFNGTGTVAIRAAGNVSSITDNGTGDYTVNFTNAMPDANYGVCGSARNSSNSYLMYPSNTSAPTTGQLRVNTGNASGVADSDTVSVALFR